MYTFRFILNSFNHKKKIQVRVNVAYDLSPAHRARLYVPGFNLYFSSSCSSIFFFLSIFNPKIISLIVKVLTNAWIKAWFLSFSLSPSLFFEDLLIPNSVTWKSQFCNRAFRLWRSTSRWGCSCTHSTGRTWRARLCPARWGGTGPRWAVRTRHTGPSYRRPAGRRVPTYPRGLRCSDLGTPSLRGTTSWLREVCCQAKTGGTCRSKAAEWQSPRTAVVLVLFGRCPATCHNPQIQRRRGEKKFSCASWWTA